MGEFELIGRLAAGLAARHPDVLVGIGDDAAVLADGLCATCDLLIEDVHFRRSTTPLADLGWKAIAVNLSDLAAMGAIPIAALIGLGVPPWLDGEAASDIYRGADECASAYGLQIAGGDVVRAPTLTLAVTALGRAPVPALRGGARAGDALCVTGPLGAARAGLLILEGDAQGGRDTNALVAAHRRPRPRVREGGMLAPHARAMLDLSDGLAADTARLAEASGVACRIDLESIPVAAGVAGVATALGRSAGWFACAGGEDYELVVALAPEEVRRAGVPLTVVGAVVAGPAGEVRFTGSGADDPPRGYDHLAR